MITTVEEHINAIHGRLDDFDARLSAMERASDVTKAIRSAAGQGIVDCCAYMRPGFIPNDRNEPIEQAPAAADPAPDDAAAIEAAFRAMNAVYDRDGIARCSRLGDADVAACRAYHAKQFERDAERIAELREQVKELRNRREIACDLLSRERDVREGVNERLRRRIEELETQLAALPSPGEVPELTRSEIADVCATVPSSEFINGAKAQEFSNWMVEFARACIRAAFAKMPGREAFDLEAWLENAHPTHHIDGYVATACRGVLKAAGIPVKESA